MTKIDTYNHKERYLKWKEEVVHGIPEITESDSGLILDYLKDMEMGLNVALSSRKGARSYTRLNSLKQRLIFLSKKFNEFYRLEKITDASERQIHEFFGGMRNGTIKRKDGKNYMSTVDYVKMFKAFWHWHQKVNRKKGIEISDITLDLDTSRDKPKWVYLTEKQIKKLCENTKYEYKVLIMFLFDTGIRAPTELMNIRVSDLYNNCKELNIRDEISKTFGRRIKLMLCSELLKEYIREKGLNNGDYVFQINPFSVNQHLKRTAKRVLGDEESPAGQRYSDLTMYDFRHCSCCYWLPRYKSESALKFRFGWKKSDKIHYYSELLGMRDTISEEDLLLDVTKTEIEQRLIKSENEKEILVERIDILENQMNELLDLVKRGQLIV
jgi:integrase